MSALEHAAIFLWFVFMLLTLMGAILIVAFVTTALFIEWTRDVVSYTRHITNREVRNRVNSRRGSGRT